LGNRFSKPVAFNHTNEKDQKVLKHVEGKNFSGYVKNLILEDIQRNSEKLKIVSKTGKGGVKIVVGR
jgi:hypothetical protein